MKTGMDIFLRTPEHETLYPGKVRAATDKGCNAVFQGGAFNLENGAEVLVFYKINRHFMQQPVRVVSVVDKNRDERQTRITLEPEATVDLVSAENRESCYSADVKAQLGEDTEMCVQRAGLQ